MHYKFVNTTPYKQGEFHQIYNFCVSGDKNKLIVFGGQKVQGQGHSEKNTFFRWKLTD